MRTTGLIDPHQAERYARLNARSDVAATAEYMAADYRPGLKNANMPIVEISPYYAPDFSNPPMKFTEQEKVGYYQSLLAGAPNAKVVSISPSRHFVMIDQPAKFQQAVHDFIATLSPPGAGVAVAKSPAIATGVRVDRSAAALFLR